MTDAMAATPAFGVFGALVVVIGWFMRSNRADRKSAAEELAVYRSAVGAQIVELKEEIRELKEEIRRVLVELEAERSRRYVAEDKAVAGSHRREDV